MAVPYYKPSKNLSGRKPDYFLHTTEDWLVLPYELQGLTPEEIAQHKPDVASYFKHHTTRRLDGPLRDQRYKPTHRKEKNDG